MVDGVASGIHWQIGGSRQTTPIELFASVLACLDHVSTICPQPLVMGMARFFVCASGVVAAIVSAECEGLLESFRSHWQPLPVSPVSQYLELAVHSASRLGWRPCGGLTSLGTASNRWPDSLRLLSPDSEGCVDTRVGYRFKGCE
jgi:hypothetical protein